MRQVRGAAIPGPAASIGLVTVPAGETPNPADLLGEADKALYAARAAGRGRVVLVTGKVAVAEENMSGAVAAPVRPVQLVIGERPR
ncbi:diguanylate cyclase [Paracoccus sp. IB05]|nr:diguanylate cyclase [Paracoccus sp. IB05]